MTFTRLGDARFSDIAPPSHERQQMLIVPLGSTEQHGRHLPFSTDTLIAEAWASALAATLDGAVAVTVAPAMPYGAAGEHQDFPGTLSIGTEATATVVVELARSAVHSFDHVVFLSGHAGNVDALRSAIEKLRYEGHSVDGVFPVLPGSDAHAGRTETSLMLHIAPDLVQLERAEPGNTKPIGELLLDLRAGGVAAVSPNGVLGDPTGATAAEGERLLVELVEHARQCLGL